MAYTSQRSFVEGSKRENKAAVARDYRGDVRNRPRAKEGPAQQFAKAPADFVKRHREPLPTGKATPGDAGYTAAAKPERMPPVRGHGPGVGNRATRP